MERNISLPKTASGRGGSSASLVIWRISDGRAGHDSQSRGLVQALNRLHPCGDYELNALPATRALVCMLRGDFPPGRQLPTPDLIIGAGHGTHLSMLAARRARGGRAVVLMKPSLPAPWFDYCLIPAHDQPVTNEHHIIETEGALNTLQASASLDTAQGLVLIGGPSRHHQWHNQQLIGQLQTVLKQSGRAWRITDSPRTPPVTRDALEQLARDNIDYLPFMETAPGWLGEQLKQSANVWVTEDSISMIYEAITAGAAVGLLSVPRKKRGRVSYAIDRLIQRKMVTPFALWEAGETPAPVQPPLNEADRCARLLLDRIDASL